MDISITKNKTKLKTFNRTENKINEINVVEVLINNIKLYYDKSRKHILTENGEILFFRIENEKGLTERIDGFKDISLLFKVIEMQNKKDVYLILEEFLKFSNKDSQILLLKDLGIPEGEYYKCFDSIAYALQNYYKFDIVKIHDILKEMYPCTFIEGMSMRDFIKKFKGSGFSKKFQSYF